MAAQKPFDADEIIESLAGETIEEVQKVALAVLSAVVVGTPVGDPKLWQYPFKPPGYVGGHARRNWIVSTRRPVNVIKGRAGKAKGKSAATSTSMNAGKRKIDEFKVVSGRIIIQNNVPYIVPLNSGHSTQAPANFVEKAVMVGRNVGRNDRKELP